MQKASFINVLYAQCITNIFSIQVEEEKEEEKSHVATFATVQFEPPPDADIYEEVGHLTTNFRIELCFEFIYLFDKKGYLIILLVISKFFTAQFELPPDASIYEKVGHLTTNFHIELCSF